VGDKHGSADENPLWELGGMRSGDVALRLSIVLSVACFIALAAGLYEIDRREKSSSATGDRNLVEIEQRNQILSNQIHVLAAQLSASERQLQALSSRVQALSDQYESRLTETERQIEAVSGRYDAPLKELEDDLRVRRLESAPVPR
jgi:TolA-binding protein